MGHQLWQQQEPTILRKENTVEVKKVLYKPDPQHPQETFHKVQVFQHCKSFNINYSVVILLLAINYINF